MEGYRIAAEFFLFNQAFLLLFLLVSAAISALAYHVYRLTKRRQLKRFSLSFLALALAHAGMFAAELFRPEPVEHALRAVPGGSPLFPFLMGLWLALYLIGLVLLASMTLKSKEPRFPLLLGAVIAAAMLLIPRPLFLFHIIACILLAFLTVHYAVVYRKQRHAGSLLVLLAFAFLLLGNLMLVFSLREMLFFTLGQILQLVGYLSFLANLVLVFRK